MIRERNGRFEVIVYLGADPLTGKERRVSRTARTPEKAKALERQLLNQRDEGQRLSEDPTLDHLLDRYLAIAQMEESSRYQQNRAFAAYVRPRMGQARLSRLAPEHLDDLYAALLASGGRDGARLSASTVAHVHAYLRAAFNLAVDWGWVARNPCARAHPPRAAKVEPAPWPSELLVAVLAQAALPPADGGDPALGVFLRVAAAVGSRRGEVCALRRGDLFLDLEGLSTLRKARALGVSTKAYEKATKTGARHAVTLGPATAVQLARHLAGQDHEAAEWDLTLGPDAFVFSDEPDCSTPWHPQSVSRRFKALRERVPGAEKLLMRNLRHWMVTEGLEAGFSARTVGGRASHANPSMTFDRYAGWVPASDAALAQVIDSALDAEPPPAIGDPGARGTPQGH